MTEDEMVGWHHRFNGYKFVQTPGDSEGQGSLACYSPWRPRIRHNLVTEQQQYSIVHTHTQLTPLSIHQLMGI